VRDDANVVVIIIIIIVFEEEEEKKIPIPISNGLKMHSIYLYTPFKKSDKREK